MKLHELRAAEGSTKNQSEKGAELLLGKVRLPAEV